MKVYDSEYLLITPISSIVATCQEGADGLDITTYSSARKRAISVRISASGREVSSNPGVSSSITRRLWTSNGFELPITEVQLRRL